MGGTQHGHVHRENDDQHWSTILKSSTLGSRLDGVRSFRPEDQLHSPENVSRDLLGASSQLIISVF